MFPFQGGITVRSRRLAGFATVPALAAALFASSGQAVAAGAGARGGHVSSGGGHVSGFHGASGAHFSGGHGSWDHGGHSSFALSFGFGFPYCGTGYCYPYCGYPYYSAPYYYSPVYYAPAYCPPYYSYGYSAAPSLAVGFSTGVGSGSIGGSIAVPLGQPQQMDVPQPPAAAPQPGPAPAAYPSAPAQTPQPTQPAPVNGAGRYHDRELGDAYMHAADFPNAARAYSRYLSAWNGDGTASRSLGFALIGVGDTQNGFRDVVNGYKAEASLYSRPVSYNDLGGQASFQRIMDAAVHAADATNSAEGWFTIAVLDQSVGNNEAAQAASARARDAGLDAAAVVALTRMMSR